MESPDQTAAATSRPLAEFHPCVWRSSFLTHIVSETNEQIMETLEENLVQVLKEEVRRELVKLTEDHDYTGQIIMVDAIQRLGIAYHFEPEIDQAMQNVFEAFDDFCKHNHDNMYATALSFRLLRQHGYKVSCNIFEKFKGVQEEFKVPSGGDDVRSVMGMLEFYEATHLRVHNDDILENGFISARNYLESVLPNLTDTALADLVDHALNGHSNRRGLTRLEARLYMSIYPRLASHHDRLFKLAKLDFNLLQYVHKKELSEIYRWWNQMDVEKKLPYVRDRIVETYFWALGIYFEPEYAVARKILTKVQSFISIIDDTYDAYGTYDELKLLTEAIERWDLSCLDQLPEYMHVFYKALLEHFQEIEKQEVVSQAGSYRVAYGKEAVKEMARAYFGEAKWREEKYTPTMEEYMTLALKTSGFISLIIISFLGIDGSIVQRDAFDWVFSEPDMVIATCIICRLSNDLVGHKFDRERERAHSFCSGMLHQRTQYFKERSS